MSLPNRVELRLVFLQALADGQWHTHEEIAQFIAKQYNLTDTQRKSKSGKNFQTTLDNQINWLKGHDLRVPFGVVEYNADQTALRITKNGLKVLQSQPDGPLTYPVLRKILGK